MQYQKWPTHLQKFDATLAGGNAPDVVEMGNTEMTKYMAAGAFAGPHLQQVVVRRTPPTGSRPSRTPPPTAAASTAFRTTAASRVVTYRTDLFKKAGASKPPTSLAAYTALAKKLAAQNSGKGFSPVYIAGQDWYVGIGFVYDYGGQIAKVYRGKWQAPSTRRRRLPG